ncbi:MAG: acyltransferase [Gammaproteobacteria bacterium]|nr:acyltransferase [Gammaproteobacteria bacterium]
MKKALLLVQVLLFILPWPIRKMAQSNVFGFSLGKGAKIGFSIISSKSVFLGANAKIGHLCVINGLDSLNLDKYAFIGNLNWISGFPNGTNSPHYKDEIDRSAALTIGEHSAITSRHLIDCTGGVFIGRFSTFAGFRSQILTHSIDIPSSRQRSKPVKVGDYCFIGTTCVLLPGSTLPNYSVLAAHSLLLKGHVLEYMLYAGSPAKSIKKLDVNSLYFSRKSGFVT